VTSFIFNDLCKYPVFKHSPILRSWGLGFPHGNVWGQFSPELNWSLDPHGCVHGESSHLPPQFPQL
jgi:hypothetical protein